MASLSQKNKHLIWKKTFVCTLARWYALESTLFLAAWSQLWWWEPKTLTFLIELFWPINSLSGNYIKLRMRTSMVLSCNRNNLYIMTVLLFASTWLHLYLDHKLPFWQKAVSGIWVEDFWCVKVPPDNWTTSLLVL